MLLQAFDAYTHVWAHSQSAVSGRMRMQASDVDQSVSGDVTLTSRTTTNTHKTEMDFSHTWQRCLQVVEGQFALPG